MLVASSNHLINWIVDFHTETINRFEGHILSFTFKINAQKYEVPDDGELRSVLLMIFSKKINVVKVFITMPQKPFSEWKLGGGRGVRFIRTW